MSRGEQSQSFREGAFSHRWKIDWCTISGFILGVGSLLGGLKGEGGELNDLVHLDSFLIVVVGTIGATLVATSQSTLADLLRASRLVFLDPVVEKESEIDKILRFTNRLRSWRRGTVSQVELDRFIFLNESKEIDDLTPAQLRFWKICVRRREIRMLGIDECLRIGAGTAPAFGVAGAIFGLMHVMHNINSTDVGPGMARAFSATIYGVFAATFVLLPAAAKIRYRLSLDQRLAFSMLQTVNMFLIPAAKEKVSREAPARTVRCAPASIVS